jgi:hypothetical protein
VREQIRRCTWRLYLEVYLEVVYQREIDREGYILAAEILIIP